MKLKKIVLILAICGIVFNFHKLKIIPVLTFLALIKFSSPKTLCASDVINALANSVPI